MIGGDGGSQQSSAKSKSQDENQFKVEDDPIFLDKQSYLSKILGNKHEFFVMIVYQKQDTPDGRMSVKVGQKIKQNLKEVGIPINVYMISRPTLSDVRTLINRVKGANIFEDDQKTDQVEIYLKTPYSDDYVFFKYKSETSFFSQSKIQKFNSKIKQYFKLFETINSEEELWRAMHRKYFSLGSPLILKVQNSTTSKQIARDMKDFRKFVFYCFERQFLNKKSSVFTLKDPQLIQKFNLKEGETYILRNDLLTRLNDFEIIDNAASSNFGKEQNFNFQSGTEYYGSPDMNKKLQFLVGKLQSYSDYCSSNSDLASLIDQGEGVYIDTDMRPKDLIRAQKQAMFVNFALPEIVFLKNTQSSMIGQLFKQISYQNDQSVLALYLSEDDKQNFSRILNFKRLYQKYSQSFYFVVVQTTHLEDLFPHLNASYPRFSIFNFNRQDTQSPMFGQYYKHLINPYQKYFLEDQDSLQESFEALDQNVQTVLEGKQQIDYIDSNWDNIYEINGQYLDSQLTNESTSLSTISGAENRTSTLKSQLSQPFLVEFSNTQSDVGLGMRRVSDEYVKEDFFNQQGIDVLRMNPENRSEQFDEILQSSNISTSALFFHPFYLFANYSSDGRMNVVLQSFFYNPANKNIQNLQNDLDAFITTSIESKNQVIIESSVTNIIDDQIPIQKLEDLQPEVITQITEIPPPIEATQKTENPTAE